MSIDFLVKLRDLCNEEIEKHTPTDVRTVQSYNPESIKWIRTTGQKGPYERYPAFQQKPKLTVDYSNLLEDLKAHEGKLTRNGLFYFLFDDGSTIGRKPSKR